jgi:hypothetical protein
MIQTAPAHSPHDFHGLRRCYVPRMVEEAIAGDVTRLLVVFPRVEWPVHGRRSISAACISMATECRRILTEIDHRSQELFHIRLHNNYYYDN